MRTEMVNLTISGLISELNKLEVFYYDFQLNMSDKTIDIIRGRWCDIDQQSVNEYVVFTGKLSDTIQWLNIEKRSL